MSINKFNPKKLLLSKWTAITPKNKERHFIVIEIIKNEDEVITKCILESVINKKGYEMDWKNLQNEDAWSMGWK